MPSSRATWNVRLSAVDNRPLLDEFAATFEQYWQASDFVEFDHEEFRKVVRAERRQQRIFGRPRSSRFYLSF